MQKLKMQKLKIQVHISQYYIICRCECQQESLQVLNR